MALYRLRSSVRIERDPGGALQVVDPELRRVLRLGAHDGRLVQALRRGATAAQLAKGSGLAPGAVGARLTALARLYLLQGKRAQQRIALGAEAAAATHGASLPAAEAPLHWPAGRNPPRHACQGTGTCCGATFLGPLLPSDRKRIVSLTFGSRVRDSGTVRLGADAVDNRSEVFEVAHVAGRDHVGMARGNDGRCVAQGDDLLCDIHREHGAAAKPVACRLFPLRFHRSPAGIHVSLILACDGYDRARGPGAAWPAREAEVRALLAEGAPAVRVAAPAEWTAGVPCAWTDYQRSCDQWFDLEPAEADGRGWLAAVMAGAAQSLAQAWAALAEGPDIVHPSSLAVAAASLGDPARAYDPAAAQAYAASLDARAADLRMRARDHDAERLTDLAAGVRAQVAGCGFAGARQVEPTARRHAHDVVVNDLPAFVAIGPVDVGLRALARRLGLVEALACVLAQRAGRATVTAADTTRALHVAYRSEPDLAALAACEAA
ncbi:MAG: YkgJ family cysteine cluster protein [Deltaproteobacteria bacterium]|nr:YkgJ family cysteine cluster protein [Deltaproteobacteria bacterium]